MRKIVGFIIMLLCVGSFIGSIAAQPSDYAGPSCIGEFCFNVNMSMLMTEAALVRRYGNGHKEGGAHCYRIPEQNIYVLIRPYHGEQRQIIDIFVSDKPSCPAARPPKIPFEPLITREGLKIGDPYKKVIALYGEPDIGEKADGIEKAGIDYQTMLNTAPFGERRLRYLSQNTTLGADIYLRRGRVSAILISMGE